MTERNGIFVLTTATFAESSARAFFQVFGIEACDVSSSWAADAWSSPRMRCVASMPFSGDFRGRMSMLLDEADIRNTVDLILGRYAIETPVEDSAVFSEMINMYGAHLLMDFQQKYGRHLNIAPPDSEPCGNDTSCADKKALTIRITTGTGQVFLFRYLMDTEEWRHV